MVRHWLLGVLMTSVLTYAAAASCSPFKPVDTSGCTQAEQHSTEFKMLDYVLHDKESSDIPAMDFLWNATIEMHLFLHPNCAKPTDTAVFLFFDMYPPNPLDPAWDTAMQDKLSDASPYPIGRRRTAHGYNNEESVIVNLLTNLVQATNTACVQKLIDAHKDRAAASFKSRVAGFRVPQGSTPVSSSSGPNTSQATSPTTTTTKPTTTTTKPTTTTTKPTTTTTTPTTTTSTTTTTPTTTTSTTTTTPTTTTTTTTTTAATTAKPMMCSICRDLQCLLMGNSVRSCPNPQQICYIEIDDVPERQITRGCMDKAECTRIHNRHHCQDVESVTKVTEVHCKFCCDADSCNTPPHLLPVSGKIYPRNH